MKKINKTCSNFTLNKCWNHFSTSSIRKQHIVERNMTHPCTVCTWAFISAAVRTLFSSKFARKVFKDYVNLQTLLLKLLWVLFFFNWQRIYLSINRQTMAATNNNCHFPIILSICCLLCNVSVREKQQILTTEKLQPANVWLKEIKSK